MDGVTRRLAAVVVVDVAGYSRLMSEDEDGTIAALRAHRNAIDPVVLNHGGRVVKGTGDGVLLEFPSAVAAVEAAIEVQALMAGRNEVLPESRRMVLRIGINLGDIVVDESGDVFGAGVNVAARVEALCEPGRVAVTDAVRDAVVGRIDADLVDQGEQSLKNIDRPVRIWSVGSVERSERYRTPTRLATLAVLPFDNMSADPEQEYFADGITEDLITALAWDGTIGVVARNSTFAHKGKASDVRVIAREVDATHVLEGSVRRAGERIRVTAQLIDAETGQHVWAERWDREIGDIFDLQDELVAEVVTRLRPSLWEHAGRRAAGRLSHDAWDSVLRGRHAMGRSTIEGLHEALAWFERARELDPDLAVSIGFSALTRFTLAVFGVPTSRGEWEEIQRDVDRALAIDPDDQSALATAAALCSVSGRPNEGIEYAERSIALNPLSPNGHHMLGTNTDKAGGHDAAVEALTEAWRLSRHDIFHFDVAADLAYAHYMAGRYAESQRWAETSIGLFPGFLQSLLVMAATLGQLGRTDEASPFVQRILEIRPRFSCAAFADRFGYADEADRTHFVDGLRKAGLPG